MYLMKKMMSPLRNSSRSRSVTSNRKMSGLPAVLLFLVAFQLVELGRTEKVCVTVDRDVPLGKRCRIFASCPCMEQDPVKRAQIHYVDKDETPCPTKVCRDRKDDEDVDPSAATTTTTLSNPTVQIIEEQEEHTTVEEWSTKENVTTAITRHTVTTKTTRKQVTRTSVTAVTSSTPSTMTTTTTTTAAATTGPEVGGEDAQAAADTSSPSGGEGSAAAATTTGGGTGAADLSVAVGGGVGATLLVLLVGAVGGAVAYARRRIPRSLLDLLRAARGAEEGRGHGNNDNNSGDDFETLHDRLVTWWNETARMRMRRMRRRMDEHFQQLSRQIRERHRRLLGNWLELTQTLEDFGIPQHCRQIVERWLTQAAPPAPPSSPTPTPPQPKTPAPPTGSTPTTSTTPDAAPPAPQPTGHAPDATASTSTAAAPDKGKDRRMILIEMMKDLAQEDPNAFLQITQEGRAEIMRRRHEALHASELSKWRQPGREKTPTSSATSSPSASPVREEQQQQQQLQQRLSSYIAPPKFNLSSASTSGFGTVSNLEAMGEGDNSTYVSFMDSTMVDGADGVGGIGGSTPLPNFFPSTSSATAMASPILRPPSSAPSSSSSSSSSARPDDNNEDKEKEEQVEEKETPETENKAPKLQLAKDISPANLVVTVRGHYNKYGRPGVDSFSCDQLRVALPELGLVEVPEGLSYKHLSKLIKKDLVNLTVEYLEKKNGEN